MDHCQCGPLTRALPAAMRRDLDAVTAELDLLDDDELTCLRKACGELEAVAGRVLVQRGANPVGDVWGDGSRAPDGRHCPAPDCGRPLTSARAHYCSGRCRMRALRERRLLAAQPVIVAGQKSPARRPVDHCVYICTSCEERFLGERQCPTCHLFNRNLGLGGLCSECEHPIVLAELVPALATSTPPARTRATRR